MIPTQRIRAALRIVEAIGLGEGDAENLREIVAGTIAQVLPARPRYAEFELGDLARAVRLGLEDYRLALACDRSGERELWKAELVAGPRRLRFEAELPS